MASNATIWTVAAKQMLTLPNMEAGGETAFHTCGVGASSLKYILK